MKHIEIIKPGIAVTQCLLVLVALIILTAFALKSTDSTMLTNGLLVILILVQLFIANILIEIFEKGGRKK